MKLAEHHIDLHGPACEGRYARPGAVGHVLSRLGPLAVQTVRMGILYTSRKVGRPMKELQNAWQIQVGGQEEGPDGGTRILLAAPMLKDAAPGLFQQLRLWDEGPREDDTAIDMIGAVVNDIRRGNRESERYDLGLLRKVGHLQSTLRKGLDYFDIAGHHLTDGGRAVVDREVTDRASAWASETPPPERVRLAGTLDMVRVSDHVFEMVLRTGDRVRAVWVENQVVDLGPFIGQDVVVEGDAVFRASGSLLRVEAQRIDAASESDMFFSRLPASSKRPLRPEDFRVRQTAETGVNAIWGAWPGDESEEEVLDALEQID